MSSETLYIDGLQIANWNQKTLREVHQAGIHSINATSAVWEGPAETLQLIGDWYQLINSMPDVARLALTVEDILEAKEAGQVAVLMGFQNASPFADDFSLVEVFYRLGVRIVQLTYNIQNHVGGSCYDDNDSGLTAFGRTVVSEMNRLGMVIDLSHVGDRTCRDAIEASRQPVAMTHANPNWFCTSPRNKPADVISALANEGGILGCCLYPNIIGGESTTRREFCEMVATVAEEIGVAHVAISSDSVRGWGDDQVDFLRNGRWRPRARSESKPKWPAWPDWYRTPEDFPHLAEGLVEVGFSEEDARNILGRNWLRYFEEVFPGADTT